MIIIYYKLEFISNCYIILGREVTEEQLKEAAFHAGVLDIEDDYLEPDFRARCEGIIPHPSDVEPNDCVDAFVYLKEHFIE